LIFNLGRRFGEMKGIQPSIKKLVIGGRNLRVVAPFYIEVDFNCSMEILVVRGNYSSTNPHVTSKNFPSDKTGIETFHVCMIQFNEEVEIPVKEVREVIRELYCREADAKELLTFGIQYPKIQKECPIIGLGSIWNDPDGRQDVVALNADESGLFRTLELAWIKDKGFPCFTVYVCVFI